MPRFQSLATLPVFLALASCASGPHVPRPTEPARANATSDRGTPAEPRYPLLVNGAPVPWSELQPVLAEIAGDQAVQEIILNRVLDREDRARGLNITDADLDAERARLAEIARADGVEELDALLRARGLGPVRLAALLRRNAILRRLVDAPEPTPAQIEQDLAIRYGTAVRARIVITATEREASAARSAALENPAGPVAGMAEAALQWSIDPSAAAGGLVPDARPADPRWAAAIAEQLRTLAPNEIGPLVAFQGGFAVVLVESRTPPRTPTDSERTAAASARAQQLELDAMRDLAQRLARAADAAVLDPALRWRSERRSAP